MEHENHTGKSILVFESTLFALSLGEEETETIPPGYDAATYFSRQLALFGATDVSDPQPGDDHGGWHWFAVLEGQNYCFDVNIALLDGQSEFHWVISLELCKSLWKSLFGKPSVDSEVACAAAAMNAIISNEPQIFGVRWMTVEEFNRALC